MPIQVFRRKIAGPYPDIVWDYPANVPVGYVPQHLPNWCWAACIEMVMAWKGRPIAQCKVANLVVGPGCCDSTASGCAAGNPPGPANVRCDCGIETSKNHTLWTGLLGNSPTHDRAILGKNQLIRALAVSPVECWCWLAEEASNHLVLVVGYSRAQDLFKVHDPCFQKADMDYDCLKKYNTYWVWEETWSNLS